MFSAFFFKLREAGIPASPTAFLRLQAALRLGCVQSLADFYTASRAILVKSERHFDRFDQVFAHQFTGAEMPPGEEEPLLDDLARALLEEWLGDPRELADMLGLDPQQAADMTPEALIAYFKERLREQKERHDGGSRWIGTGGTSPVGHSGFHPGGMRVGGTSRNRSAVKVALERRYRDYDMQGPLTQAMVGEALKRLRHMRPEGPRDVVNIEASIRRTMQNGGEIEIVFDRRLKDRLKVVLAIDNGGWSMDPYVSVVQRLFDHARAQFKDLRTLYFHNTIFSTLWADAARIRRPVPIEELAGQDPETRLVVLGDASMAPYELMARDGSIYVDARSGRPSIECLRLLAASLRHAVWLNPVPAEMWSATHTIGVIARIFPMFELSLDGLERAVAHLMAH
jgi:hypothetical protein